MKRIGIISIIVAVVVMLWPADGFSQKRKAPPRKKNPRAAVKAPPAQTVPEQPVVNLIDSTAYNDSLSRANLLPVPLKSMRPTTTVVGDLIRDKTPLAYDNIRVDDQVYKQVIWRDISIFERINAPFRYESEEDDGSQTFFFVLLQHIRDGDITAFDAVNDRFTTPLKISDISKAMTGGSKTIQVPDMVNDPDGTKGLMRDTTIFEEFNVNTIIGYRVKEEIIFDRETSRMHFRTLGLAPLKEKDIAGQKVMIPMFWVYYPDARPYLAKHEAYNPRNMAMRMSWEEIFESRYYSSTIYKSTISNAGDKPLSFSIKDPMLRLFEGETIKEQVFNWEQDQWSY